MVYESDASASRRQEDAPHEPLCRHAREFGARAACPCGGMPAKCNDAYLAAMLSEVGRRCPSHHFHLTEAGKSRMCALMRTSGEGECMDLALAKITVDLSRSEMTAAAANMDAVELWCGSAATFLLPLGDDLVDADK